MTNSLYREGIGILLLNQKNLIFVGKRIDTKGNAWQMPQGGIDPGETPEISVYRELEEETGITVSKVKPLQQSREWIYYDIPENISNNIWNGIYKGQKQKWFAFRFLGSSSDINLKKSKHPEFSMWKWATKEEVFEKIVPFKKELYKKIFKEFENLL